MTPGESCGGGLVSVVMPVLNEADSVESAVRSVLAQTHADLEVLVVDGRSDDATLEVVEALVAEDRRVRVLDNPRRTIAEGLNVGLQAARGALVARVDAHATVNDEYLELALSHLAADPGLAAVGGRRTGVAASASGRAIALALSSPFGVGDSINHFATQVQETDHASFGVYRTAVAREVGGWDVGLIANEDVDFDFRVAARGHRILYEPEMVIRWHVRESVRELGRQYRRYGRGKGSMVRKNGMAAMRARHLAPPLLVGALSVAGVALVTRHRRVAEALVAPYALGVAAASALTWLRAVESGDAEGASGLALAPSFVAMHTAWGVGFVEGLAGRRPRQASKG